MQHENKPDIEKVEAEITEAVKNGFFEIDRNHPVIKQEVKNITIKVMQKLKDLKLI